VGITVGGEEDYVLSSVFSEYELTGKGWGWGRFLGRILIEELDCWHTFLEMDC
jgi:hypothetical protein